MTPWIKLTISENRNFIIIIILMSVFRSSLADWNSVPTGSMKPTIIEGDRIIINKLAYDLKLPFSNISIAKLGDPQRGDIIIFNSKVSAKRLVKRVIGLPGDAVSMKNNALSINGKALTYGLNNADTTPSVSKPYYDLTEYLYGAVYSIRISRQTTAASNLSKIIVPKGVFLALGDNRDNSADSRYIGFIPRAEIIGRSKNVAMSFDYQDYYLLRKERFFKAL
ncbi:MAG: signal peptidase I [Arenicella sp.]|jgi:signal peptidase I